MERTLRAMCGNATMGAFGVKRPNGLYNKAELLEALWEGTGCKPTFPYHTRVFEAGMTLGEAIERHQADGWVIWTDGHVMALKGGVLTDTGRTPLDTPVQFMAQIVER